MSAYLNTRVSLYSGRLWRDEDLDALVGVYADPPSEKPLWYREGADVSALGTERAEGWGTFDAAKGGSR